MNRPLTVTPPDNKGVTYSYNGLTTSVKDANDHTTSSTSDVWGQTVSVTPPTGPGVQYAYDVMGNLTGAIRGGLPTTIHYDKAGHKLDMDDPDMGYWMHRPTHAAVPQPCSMTT